MRRSVALVAARNKLVARLAAPLSEEEPISTRARAISVNFHVWSTTITLASTIFLNLQECARALGALSSTFALATAFEIFPAL